MRRENKFINDQEKEEEVFVVLLFVQNCTRVRPHSISDKCLVLFIRQKKKKKRKGKGKEREAI